MVLLRHLYRLVMKTVFDVLEKQGRSALLPNFVIPNILSNYKGCVIASQTVTGICPPHGTHQKMTCEKVAAAINGTHLSMSETLKV
ncbi:hypothetical protein KIN20_012581 [Parelaphostrongylus tenuis]|uniref:Uncharacterized protein n=1 Tax=Parelaphostrongylus tenuis TaxID=148309 RepID=A0AAD5MX57_PARTN|nr:hypothetical protein KIN20_012581 [Parelaphostrongylus tenuis]